MCTEEAVDPEDGDGDPSRCDRCCEPDGLRCARRDDALLALAMDPRRGGAVGGRQNCAASIYDE